MTTWREHMPKGMLLKSEGYASSLSAAGANGAGRLETYCRTHGLPYRHLDLPVPLEVFTDYAMDFQKRFAPKLEEINVAAIECTGNEFALTLDNGARLAARHVIMATGITWFNRMPEILVHLPTNLVSHTYDHHIAEQFVGRDVVVLGAGASAADVAILLSDSGANVQILARNANIRFHRPPPPRGRTSLQKLRHPQTVIGPGWRSKFFTTLPLAFHRLPAVVRAEIVRTHLGPAPGWFVKQKIDGRIPTLRGVEVEAAEVRGYRVHMTLLKDDGTEMAVTADHAVAATGYSVDLRRIRVLSHDLRGRIAHHRHSPLLSDNFESSVPGLYFIGPAAANAFGPLMRFMVGAEWAAPRLALHLAKKGRAVRQGHSRKLLYR
jgi:thioredoxin reductase